MVIFSGESGRTVLYNTLRARGAEVRKIACYKRVQAKDFPQSVFGEVDIVVISSVEVLESLLALSGSKEQVLRHLPIVVTSARLVDAVKAMNWQGPCLLATDATNSAIIKVLKEWRQEGF